MTNQRPREPCADYTTLLHQVLLFHTGIKSYFMLLGKERNRKKYRVGHTWESKQPGLLIECVNPWSYSER